MKIVGCDLHARQQTIAMVDTETGGFSEKTLNHEGNAAREFYAALEGPVVVGIEATGAMQWFLELLEELGIECRVGHPAKIRAAETRKQKHDRRDAGLLLDLLVIAAHLAGDRSQSRPASRPWAVKYGGAERTSELASATLHRSKTKRATRFVRAIAKADPRTGQGSGGPAPTKAPGAPLAHSSRRG
jgi:hypothetical protein